MTININSIQDSKMRGAAQAADSQGENAYNGKLDANEVSVFINKAKEAGCEMSAIMNVVNSDSEISQSEEIRNAIRLQEEIDTLAREIEGKEAELAELEETYNDMKPNFWESLSTSQKVGGSIGAVVYGGAAVLGTVVALATLPVSMPVLVTAGAIAGGLGVVGGGALGSEMGRSFGDSKPPYEATVAENQAQEFARDNDLQAKRNEIAALRRELENKMAQL